MREIFYVSGLPRSGSTLLMNLMAQHPQVFATPTSGLCHLMNDIKASWNNILEHRADKKAGDPENLKRILYNTLHHYHDTNKTYIIDKCRGWGSVIEMLEEITNKKSKIIAPVRDIKDILASFEILYRKGIYRFPTHHPMPQRITTEGRIQHWVSMEGEVGVAYSILKDAFQRGLGDRFLLVDYDYLTMEPEKCMNVVWDFLEIPRITHDFNNVINQTPEDDSVYNYVDLHKIKPSVTPSTSKAEMVLGGEICEKIGNPEFWKYSSK